MSLFLARIRDGTLRPNVPDSLVNIFIQVCTIEAIQDETAAAILRNFIGYLQEERYKDVDGRAVLAQTNRAEADRIITEVRQVQDRVASLTMPPAPAPHPPGEAAVVETAGGADVTGEDEVPWHKQIDRSRNLIEEGAPRSALRVLEALDKEIPPDVSPEVIYRVTMNKGACLMMLNNPHEAISEYEKALEAMPHNRKALEQLAQAKLQTGDHQGAKSLAESVIESHHDSDIAWSVLIRLNPDILVPDAAENSGAVQIAKGLIAMGTGKPDKAVKHFRTALKAKPDDAQIKILLADALYICSVQGREEPDGGC